MGKKEGKKLSDTGVLLGRGVAVSAEGRGSGGATVSVAGSVGFAFTGRSMASEGTGVSVLMGTWVTLVVATMASSIVWSSSCSFGRGCKGCLLPSMASPKRFKRQSMKIPLLSLTLLSLTITVHFPMPDSPLVNVSLTRF